jgi:serpin B
MMRKPLLLMTVICAWILSCSRDFSTLEPKAVVREFTPLEKALVRSSNEFGFRLFRQVNTEEGGRNLFLSPLSVSMALGMTLNGAAGGTE